jgi:hypothetical protein
LLPAWADDLGNHRKRLFDAWSNATMHESYEFDPKVKSRGQCGVTSAWLIGELKKRRAGLELSYCYGTVRAAEDDSPVLEWHCWVEVGGEDIRERWVVDLTGDQVPALSAHPVLCWPHDELRDRLGFHYSVDHRRLTAVEVLDDPVQERLSTLRQLLREKR